MSPMKMFEYMASQRPIIASDLPAIKEILNPDNAFLIKSDSSISLAQSIEKILQNKILADRILKRAYQDIKQYTWQKRVKNIINFINEKI